MKDSGPMGDVLQIRQFVPGEHAQTSGAPSSAALAGPAPSDVNSPEYEQWHQPYFRSTGQSQYHQMVRGVHEQLGTARRAIALGDRPAVARALTAAARRRQALSGWSHLKG